MSKDDMDKFEDEEMKKIRPIKRTLFDKLFKQNVIRNKPKKKEYNERLIKDGIIRHFFEREEDYYEPKRVNNFWNNNIISNMKVMVIQI